MRRPALFALLGIALAAIVLPAVGSTPNTITVGLHQRSGQWRGGPYSNANVGPHEGVECPTAAQDPASAVCDHIKLTVDVPASYWRSHGGGVRITLTKTDGGLEFFVYDSAGGIVGEDGTGDAPSAFLWHAHGAYEIRVNPEATILTQYEGSVSLVTTKGAARPLTQLASATYHAVVEKTQPSKLPRNVAIRSAAEPLAFRATYVGRRAAEPTIGIDRKGGVLFPAGQFDALPQGSPKQLARTVVYASTDGGKTFHPVQPPLVPGTNTDGEPVTLDPYVYVDQDTGRWFDVDLKGADSSIEYSDDQGVTWTRGAATNPGVNDHQTLTAGVVPANSPLVTTDAKFPKILYYCTNQIYSSVCARSLDGGRTFVTSGQAYPPVDTTNSDFPVCLSLHGHVITDHAGRVFLPRGHCNRPFISISSDAGTTWHQVLVSDTIGAAFVQSSVAVDSADNLYYVWWDDVYRMPYLSISRDHGETWGPARMVAPPGVYSTEFPSVTAGDPGRIAISFPGTPFADQTDMTRPWNQYVVVSTNVLSPNPAFQSAIANPGGPSDPILRGHCANNRCANLYDFLDVETAPDASGTIWATTVDTCTAVKSCNTVRAPGADGIVQGPQDGVSSDGQGVAIKQISGPRLRVKPLAAPTFNARAMSPARSPGSGSGLIPFNRPPPTPAASHKPVAPADPWVPGVLAAATAAFLLTRIRKRSPRSR